MLWWTLSLASQLFWWLPPPPVGAANQLDLRPYFTGPLVDRAWYQWEERRYVSCARTWARFQKKVPSLHRHRVEFLRALCLQKAGRRSQAALLFTRLAGRYPLLADHIRYYRAIHLLYRRNKEAKALSLLSQIPSDSRFYEFALYVRAYRLYRKRKYLQSWQLLQSRRRRRFHRQARVLQLRARLLLKLRRYVEAASNLRRLWILHPHKPQKSTWAEERLRWLSYRSRAVRKDAVHGLRFRDHINRLSRLVRNKKRYHLALAVYARVNPKKFVPSSLIARTRSKWRKRRLTRKRKEMSLELKLRRGWLHLRHEEVEEAIDMAQQVYLQTKDPEREAEALLVKFRAQREANRRYAALHTARRTAARHPASPWGELALLEGGILAERRGWYDKAIKLYRAHLALYPFGKPNRRARVLVGLAFCLLRTGKRKKARRFYRAALANKKYGARAAYFLFAQDKQLRKNWTLRFPLSYHALRYRVERGLPPLPRWMRPRRGQPPHPLLARQGIVSRSPQLQRTLELLRLGYRRLARLTLLYPHYGRNLNVSELLAAGLLLQRFGNYRTSVWFLKRHRHRIPPTLYPLALPLLYPRGYRHEVLRAARATKLNPLLLHALIREESAYNPHTYSWARAIGLTQLLRSTAWRVGRSLRMEGYISRWIWEPEENILVGATYLSRQLKRFGQTYLAIGAYNSGPHNVRRFLRLWPKAPEPIYIELIRIDETRRYTRRVLESFWIYQGIYAPPSSSTPTPRPKPRLPSLSERTSG